MASQKDFNKFINNIEPSKSTIQYISSIQKNLRNYLKNHDTYKEIHEDTFLSGSYAKHTSIRPSKNDKKRDVDIIVVTSHDRLDNSNDVLEELRDTLLQSETYNTASVQHHSVGIEMGQVSVDVVPVIKDTNDDQLYYIGDSETGGWSKTDPKGHKVWSTQINHDNNNAYKRLVKIIKWWRRNNCPEDAKYPKGIVLEKIIADNIGDPSSSTEDLLIETMEKIVSAYKEPYVDVGLIPSIDDPSEKIKDNNLLSNYSVEDFSAFIYKIDEHIKLLNDEGVENNTWRKILGDAFPKGTSAKSVNNILACARASHRRAMPWPYARGGGAFITLQVRNKEGEIVPYENNGEPLEKGCSLDFRAFTGVRAPYTVKWQVTNTGEEASKAGCLRGEFYNSDVGLDGRHEVTSYTGSHSVQCFIIKRGICVAKSKDFIINIH